MQAWILAARPKTLPAAAVPVWVGSLPALSGATPQTGSWILFGSALLSCLCIQIATNFFNDAIDHRKGADTSRRLGPVRATAAGWLPPRTVLTAGLAFCVAATLVAIPMISTRGWPIVLIGVVSLCFAYAYTGGPFPLAYKGLGEVFVILFFGFVAVCGSYFVQTGQWGGLPMAVLGLQCGLYSGVLLAINNLRDRPEDSVTGKQTLAVRFGETFARWEIALFCFVPPLLWPLVTSEVSWLEALLPAVAGLAIVWGVFRCPPGSVYNRFLALAAFQLLLFAAGVTSVFWSR